MPPIRPRFPTGLMGLDWLITDDGSRTLWDQRLQATYHSGCGAISESLAVYVINSGICSRLQSGEPARVFEVGFGTGTNFLLTAALANQGQALLEYWAAEHALLAPNIYRSLELEKHLPGALERIPCGMGSSSVHQPRPLGDPRPAERVVDPQSFRDLDWMAEKLATWLQTGRLGSRPPEVAIEAMLPQLSVPGSAQEQEYVSMRLTDQVHLHLLLGDVRRWLGSELLKQQNERFDAIFFDPFSPEANPELWSHELFEAMHRLLRPHGSLTSYCVKSSIQRSLRETGFQVTKMAGPLQGKREVLLARKTVPVSA